MNKKLISLAVAAAMTAPAAALAEAVLYGKAHLTLDYVDVDENADFFGPGTFPNTSVPVNGDLLVPDTVFIGLDDDGVPVSVQLINSGTDFDAPSDGFTIGGTEIDGILEGDDIPGDAINPSEDFSGWDMNSRSSRIGVKGSEDLGGGLQAIYQIEFEVPILNSTDDIDDNDRGRVRMRNSYAGLKGNWGTFFFGRHDTPLKSSTGKLDLFNDTIVDYKAALGFQDLRLDNTITYISPSFAGFSFAGSVIPSGGDTPIGTGVPGDNPDGIADAFSLAAIYKNGPFYASLAYERLGEDHWKGLEENAVDSDGAVRLNYGGVPNYGNAEDWDYWRAGLGILDWNGFYLTGLYEGHSNVFGAPEDADMDIWQIQAGYKFGNNMIKAAYGQNEADSCVGAYSTTCRSAILSANPGTSPADVAFLNQRDFDNWVIGFDHYFSKRTSAYALYTQTESDQTDSDWSAFSLGIVHKF